MVYGYKLSCYPEINDSICFFFFTKEKVKLSAKIVISMKCNEVSHCLI